MVLSIYLLLATGAQTGGGDGGKRQLQIHITFLSLYVFLNVPFWMIYITNCNVHQASSLNFDTVELTG